MIISTNIHNHIQAPQNNQANFKNNLRTSYSIDFLQSYFALAKKLTQKGPSKVMDYILWLGYLNASLSVSVSQLNIAKACGLSTPHGDRQVRRILRSLEAHGFISKSKRVIVTNGKYRQVSTYIINSLFFNKQIRVQLQHLLKNLSDDILKRKMNNYKAKLEHEEKKSQEAYIDSVYEHLNTRSVLSKNSLSIQANTRISYKKCPVYLERNIHTHTHEGIHYDDGGPVSKESSESVWNLLSGNETVTVLKTINQKRDNVTVLSLSSTSFLKDNSSHIQQPVSSMKHETLYTKTILPITDQLKSIRLTIWGQIKLMAYPEAAILYADGVLLASKKEIDNPWTYFVGICKRYCEENQLEVKWSIPITLGKQYSMPQEGPWIDESFKADKPVVKRKSYSKPQEDRYDRAKDVARVGRELKEQMAQKKASVVGATERERLQALIDGMKKAIELNPGLKFMFQSNIARAEKSLMALDESESTEDKPLSDKDTVGIIMSKTPGEFNAIKSFVQSITQSAQPHEFVTKRHDLNTQHEVGDDLVDSKPDFQSTSNRGQFVDSSFDDVWYDESSYEDYENDPFGDRS